MCYYCIGDVMKKKNLIIVCSIVLVVILGILLFYNINSNKYGLFELKYDAVMEKIKNKEDFVLVISQTSCTHCVSYKPVLKSVAKKYKIKTYYIDVDLLSDKETDEFKKYVSYSDTPATLFIKNGSESTRANRIIGEASEEKIVSKLKQNNFIE